MKNILIIAMLSALVGLNGCITLDSDTSPLPRHHKVTKVVPIKGVRYKCTGTLTTLDMLKGSSKATFIYSTRYDKGDRVLRRYEGLFVVESVKEIPVVLYKLSFSDRTTILSLIPYDVGDYIGTWHSKID